MMTCQQGEGMLLHVLPAGERELDARKMMKPVLHIEDRTFVSEPLWWMECVMLHHSKNQKIYTSMSMLVGCLGSRRQGNSAKNGCWCVTHLLAKSQRLQHPSFSSSPSVTQLRRGFLRIFANNRPSLERQKLLLFNGGL
jgi:hypothetical protein